MNIKDINIFYEDGHYTADIAVDDSYIITEGKTFDELLKMIDDALKGLSIHKSYSLKRAMPVFTFNFSHNAIAVQSR